MTLEQLLADAQNTGLRGFTIWPTDGGFQASATFDGKGWRVCTAETPQQAALDCLGAERDYTPPAPRPAISESELQAMLL